ncbi:response regulator [Paenibacillus sp. P96]|uniref:Response regulator n=1 Tax=Paenibacillus zeirhizosphaerae TaxID=2987519 RepID=A0ABT9FPV2_9BACL|nr:response regulator [Paenibacillus sp. P96]MDP4096768.1 response regulator [Paenibacillus sp. P96]
MVTALLVDDERPVLDNLQSILPWNDMGIEITGTAGNGMDALQLAEREAPDLILCDIRMPMMDGLTFISELRSRGINSDILLLTGYQEFEYARTALKHGVKEYITKPIDYYMLENVLRSLAAGILMRKERESKLQARDEEIGCWVKRNRIREVLTGEAWSTPAPPVSMTEEEESYALFVAEACMYFDKTRQWSVDRKREWNRRVSERLEGILQSRFVSPFVFQVREGEWCAALDASLQPEPFPARAGLQEMTELFVGICADSGMEGRLLVHPGPLQTLDLAAVYHASRHVLLQSGERLCLLSADEQTCGRKNGDDVIETAKHYISAHLCSDLSVEELAEYTGISGSYFCHLFKARCGMTFLEYVTRERLAAAKALLAGSNYSISAICSAVGYRERRYFTKVFHKHFGLTPSEYRDQLRAGMHATG